MRGVRRQDSGVIVGVAAAASSSIRLGVRAQLLGTAAVEQGHAVVRFVPGVEKALDVSCLAGTVMSGSAQEWASTAAATASAAAEISSCSQTRMTTQPSLCKAASARRSRSTLRCSFGTQ